MKVLVIGNDPKIFDKNSENHARIREYAGLFDLYAVVSKTSPGFDEMRGGNFHFYPTNSRAGLFWFLKAASIGKKIARAERVDIIDAQDAGESGLAARFIARSVGIPFRLQIHTDIFSPHYRSAGWKEYLRFRLAKLLIPKASCIRVVSERIKKSIISRLNLPREVQPLNVSVLPIFTDVGKFMEAGKDPRTEDRFKNYDFKMITAGRFVDKEKNFSMLIEMMRDFVKVCPKALLVIVGDGPDMNRYNLQATSYKLLGKNIIIEPWRNDLPSFYKSFDIYLMSSNFEGWGRTVIEAMSAGLPVVMTDVGVAGEVVRNGENGLVVPVGDENAFLNACFDLYKDAATRKRLGENAGRTAKILAGKQKSEYLASYKEALAKCAGA